MGCPIDDQSIGIRLLANVTQSIDGINRLGLKVFKNVGATAVVNVWTKLKEQVQCTCKNRGIHDKIDRITSAINAQSN